MNYKFSYDREPTDEELDQIMSEATEKANKKNDRAFKAYMGEISDAINKIRCQRQQNQD